jgi:hypothetical protein
MPKDERLQLRMEKRLKEWFKRYAESFGGMSRVVTSLVEKLREENKDGEGDGRESSA